MSSDQRESIGYRGLIRHSTLDNKEKEFWYIFETLRKRIFIRYISMIKKKEIVDSVFLREDIRIKMFDIHKLREECLCPESQWELILAKRFTQYDDPRLQSLLNVIY